jgi:hypothetical protein
MGLDIALVDEVGQTIDSVGDPKNFLHKLLPAADEDSPTLLSKIDWYGDTVFNYLQIKQFLREWGQLESAAASSEERDLLVAVRSLAVRCRND